VTSTRPFTILVVCTGNICRSPLAEQLLSARLLGSATPFVVTSAGTMAQDGAPMDDLAAEQSRLHGGVPDGHEATYLTEKLAESADLVLTASREHRSAVVRLSPRATRRTFTLRQFARLADSLGLEELESAEDTSDVVRLVAGQRGMIPPATDGTGRRRPRRPGRSLDVHERAAADVDDAVSSIVAALRAPDRRLSDAGGRTDA
jgi:protein-tyrosine phosphatase